MKQGESTAESSFFLGLWKKSKKNQSQQALKKNMLVAVQK
jgi:hypothetical protein